MVKTDFPWLEELGLSNKIISNIPEGETPLAWAFKSGSLDETAYTHWASSYYQHPAIKSEFFSLAFDASLIEKFSKLYTWSETCYPVYFWQDTLFVACLEPVKLHSESKVCFVISSYSAMVTAWDKHLKPTRSVIHPSATDLQPLSLSMPPIPQEKDMNSEVKTPELSSIDDLDFSLMTNDLAKKNENNLNQAGPSPLTAKVLKENDNNKNQFSDTPPPIPVNLLDDRQTTIDKTQKESLDNLDFKNLGSLDSHENDSKNNENLTQTGTDISINNETFATSISKDELMESSPDMDHRLPDMSFAKEELNLELPDENDNDRISHNEGTITESHEPSNADSDSWTQNEAIGLNLNDDYTPLPFLTKTEQVNIKKAQEKNNPNEQTLTDHARPAHIPSKHLISEEDLTQNTVLNSEHGRKGIISHIFHLLKRDYKDLMWVELFNEGQYFPQYCYGSWDLKEKSWQLPINILQPNIFKIAYTTSLPFHGPISDNHFNEQYFELWLRSQRPDFATIYPVCYDDYCYGFIVGFSKGPEFNEISSLKKIENLISICKNNFLAVQSKKAG